MEQLYSILDHIRLHKILHYNKPNNKRTKDEKEKENSTKTKKGGRKKRVHHKTTSIKPHNLPLDISRTKTTSFQIPTTHKNTKEKKRKRARGEELLQHQATKKCKARYNKQTLRSLPLTVAH